MLAVEHPVQIVVVCKSVIADCRVLLHFLGDPLQLEYLDDLHDLSDIEQSKTT